MNPSNNSKILEGKINNVFSQSKTNTCYIFVYQFTFATQQKYKSGHIT